MNKLWNLFAISLIFSIAIAYRDKRINQLDPGRKDRILTVLMILYLGIFCGLRTWYNDTVTYIQIYEQTPTLSEFVENNTNSFAQGIGFALLNSALKTLGFSTQDYLMFYAVITVACYVIFVRRYSDHFPLAVFLMFTTGFFTFTFAAVKQCMATAICLLALPFLFQKKQGMYILLVGLATLFHPYALVYLLLLLMDFRPLTWRTYFFIAAFIAIGFGLNRFIGPIVDITAMMGANYDMSSFVGEGVSIFRVMVCFVPVILTFFFGGQMFRNSTRQENVFFNMTMLNALIMFVGLFGTANYFARLANYFLPAQAVVLPWMLYKFKERARWLLTIICIVGYLCYFYYENGVLRVFDDIFSRISFLEYLQFHFGV